MKDIYTWQRLTSDNKVSNTPCLIATVVVMPHDSKQAKAVLYDGESSSDPQIIEIKTATGVSKSINFNPPLQTSRGLFVDFTSDADEVLVHYASEKE